MKNISRFAIVPALIGSLFGEVAAHHEPEPHGTRTERTEVMIRRSSELAWLSRGLIAISSGKGRDKDAPTNTL